MEGKIVKVKDLAMLQYIYPEFITLSYVNFLNRDDKVIYVGKPFKGLDEYLAKNTKAYINTVGTPDIDLTTNEALIKYCYDKKQKNLSNSTKYFLEGLNDKDLWTAMKIFLQIGKLPYEIKKDVSIYKLFESFSEPTSVTLKVLFNLLETYPIGVLESSLLTFLERVVHNSNESVSNKYGLLINSTKNKYGKNIKPSLLAYTKSSKTDLDFINLIMSIRGV